MTQFNYNDIIEYIDCTYDLNFEDAKHWCNDNNAQLIEIIEDREEKEVEEPDILDPSKTHKVTKLFRYFKIVKNPEPEPQQVTNEEIKQERELYRKMNIDSKTLERMRKMANNTWTEEDEQEYLALDAQVTQWIEENLPYIEEE